MSKQHDSTSSSSTLRYDCIVMGGGMVGAAVAIGLAQVGFNVAVVEAAPLPEYQDNEVPHLRVSAISYASEQILRNLGAWNALKTERMCQYRRLAVNELPARSGIAAKLPDISNWARTEFTSEEAGKSHLGHIIENDLIQLALHQRMAELDSISLFCPKKADAIQVNEAQARVDLDDGQVLLADLLIGADGAQSQVRAVSGIGQFREQYEQHAFVVNVSYEGQQQDITWQSFTAHGPIAFLPLPDVDGRHFASLVWYDKADSINGLMALDDAALMRHFQSAYPQDLPKLLTIEARGRFPLFKSHANTYVKPGIALVGDAAHTINPLAGQGVNLGFMDAAVLVETLAKARLEEEAIGTLDVLQRYQRSRRLANQSMMSLMDVFYHGFGNKHLPVRIVRNLGLGLAQRAGFAKKKVVAYAIGASGDLPRLARPA